MLTWLHQLRAAMA